MSSFPGDTILLDWLEEHALGVDFVADPDNLVQVHWGTDKLKVSYGRTLRLAAALARLRQQADDLEEETAKHEAKEGVQEKPE